MCKWGYSPDFLSLVLVSIFMKQIEVAEAMMQEF